MEVLVGAWHAIRRNAETSQQIVTKRKAREFGEKLPANLRKIADRLRKGYIFSKAYGATPPKGPGKADKRPIVVAPIEDRIVQRAILDVLQASRSLRGIQRVLNTRTSIGGVPGRGVDHAIQLFQERAEAGDQFVAGSDIKGFFTRIPRHLVTDFLRTDGVEGEFVELVDRALRVELSNADKLSAEDLRMFPTGPDGVAQGCPLSALAGNIILQGFDEDLNTRGITCIRYIDDFILLGSSAQSVDNAMEAARSHLSRFDMDIYEPVAAPSKAFRGSVDDGWVFLGYELRPGVFPPASASVQHLLSQLRSLIGDGKRSMMRAMRGETLRSYERCYAQTIVAIDNTVRGWRGAYRASNCPSEFAKIDAAIDRELHDFRRFFSEKMASSNVAQRRRLLRVQLLID